MSLVTSGPRRDGVADEILPEIREGRAEGRAGAPDRSEGVDWSGVLGPLPSEASGSFALGASVGSALDALKSNKMRAFLTMLGIIIGVGAVIIMISLTQGARATVESRLSQLGTNMLTIVPGSANSGGVNTGEGALTTLTDLDVQAIQRQIPGITAVSPILSAANVQVVANNRNWNTTVQAGYPTVFKIQGWDIARGAAFNQADEQSSALVCDIGETVRRNLFGTANPVGQRILVRNVPCTVKGVLAVKGSNGLRDQDDVIFMPYSTAQIRLFQRTSVNSVFVQAANTQGVDRALVQISALLRERHHLRAGQPDDFRIQNNNQIIQAVQQTTNTLTLLLAGIAAISLVVGGIGIMNIMLVSVTERTREIGIRMAVGARPRNILSQFLVEAVFLSAVGGIFGILLGVGLAVLMSRAAGWNSVVTGEAVLLSFGFAALVGIFFGYYPARKASQLDPIEALRYE